MDQELYGLLEKSGDEVLEGVPRTSNEGEVLAVVSIGERNTQVLASGGARAHC